MKFSTTVQAGLLASAMAAAMTQGYTFSASMASTDSASAQSDSLTTNEEDRIYGGSEADAANFPYIVSLREDEAGGTTYCGGTLIASQYVLTAGHCVKTDGTTMYASIGSAYGSGTEEGEQIKVAEGYVHPMYNKSTHLYDVGVLKLETAASESTLALCAADGSDETVGTVATVRGWGLTENGSESETLQEVNVAIISNADCNKMYENRITDGMICAGDGNGKDSCNGDSGGPLMANDVLVGLVSWGGECGVDAGVYTRVSFVQDYINDILNGGTGSSFTESASGSAGQDTSATTTETPATETPVTEAPTTESPVTAVPATEAPTAAPTTVAPTTESPSANSVDQSETTESPATTEAPVTEAPAPITEAPATESPVTDAPVAVTPPSSSTATSGKGGKGCASNL